MYVVTTVDTQNKECFETFESAVDYVEKEVKQHVKELYDSDILDKYGVEDALWDLKNHITKNNGYSYPDLSEEWEIKERDVND